jgi:hypothetical protein
MLRKLIEIDMNMKSDLNKKNLQPVAFKVRKPSKGMPSMRPQLKMNMGSRVDELREIANGNILMMRKLQQAKPLHDAKQIEHEQK